jgi:hypothetical protein
MTGDPMEIREKQLPWGNTSRYWMNVGVSLDEGGNVRLEVVKHVPNMTSFGMPGFDEQLAFNAKMEKIQDELCRRLEAAEKDLRSGIS